MENLEIRHLGLIFYGLVIILMTRFVILLPMSKIFLFSNPISNLRKLIGKMQWLIARANHQLTSEDLDLPDFKFYPQLVQKLVHYRSQYGVCIREGLLDIRRALSKELVFEKSTSSARTAGFLQFFMVFSMGVLFFLSTQALLTISLNLQTFLMALGWQFFGFLSFHLSFKFCKHQYFYHFECFVLKLYLFKVLWGVGMPISTIVSKIDLDEVSEHGELKFLTDRMQQIIQVLIRHGEDSSQEIQLICEDYWNTLNEKFEKFTSFMGALKLIHLCLFFLPGYLGIIYCLLASVQL